MMRPWALVALAAFGLASCSSAGTPGGGSASSAPATGAVDARPTAPTTATSATTATTATTADPPATPQPAAGATVAVLPAELRLAMTGPAWRPGCPVGLDDLRLVEVPFVDLAGATRRGRLVVHRDVAAGVAQVFDQLYAQRFPIERMDPIEAFGGDDDASMAADNTSAFNCRVVDGTTRWSEHSYGRAVDVNPRLNPWVRGTQVDPPNGAAYLDRTDVRPGMIVAGDSVVRTFAAQGWQWGGDQRQAKDYQHFSTTGR